MSAPIEAVAKQAEMDSRANHKHRFLTDEDGACWPCACGEAYSREASDAD